MGPVRQVSLLAEQSLKRRHIFFFEYPFSILLDQPCNLEHLIDLFLFLVRQLQTYLGRIRVQFDGGWMRG